MKKNTFFSTFTNGRLRVKLIFDDGFAERPIYSIKAFTNEKNKGIFMVELIGANFNLSSKDLAESLERKLAEWDEDSMEPTKFSKGWEKEQVKFTRDEKGNIVSPFRSKKKLT